MPRLGVTWAWSAQTLAARMMGAEARWGHPAFFDYMDRTMLLDRTQIHKTTFYAGWKRHRRNYPAPSARSGPRVLNAWRAYLKEGTGD